MTTIPVNRLLSECELALIVWLLKSEGPIDPDLERQLEHVRVVGLCSCGCPTIDLAVDGVEAARAQTIGDFLIETAPGVILGVILHISLGYLSELEIYSANGGEPFILPTPEMMEHSALSGSPEAGLLFRRGQPAPRPRRQLE